MNSYIPQFELGDITKSSLYTLCLLKIGKPYHSTINICLQAKYEKCLKLTFIETTMKYR